VEIALEADQVTVTSIQMFSQDFDSCLASEDLCLLGSEDSVELALLLIFRQMK
jgi:hypothetical protein